MDRQATSTKGVRRAFIDVSMVNKGLHNGVE